MALVPFQTSLYTYSRKLCFTPNQLNHSRILLKPITANIENQWAPPLLREERIERQRQRQRQAITLSYEDEVFPRNTQKRVAVFWDLDNKPPKVGPYDAAIAVREMAQMFGVVVEMAAFANRHAFSHVPYWIVEERRERKQLDFMESKGLVTPDQPYICGVCGRKCNTNVDLRKHFKQLHERERQKKMSRMDSLKGKRKAKFKQQFRVKDEKYQKAARNLLFPKLGYGLASELRRAGVYVRTVEDKPQAADTALKAQILHSINTGIDCMFLISDDSDFSGMLDKARNNNMRTVVLGDSRALISHADLWLSWDQVTTGNAWDAIHTVVHKWSAEEAVLDRVLNLQSTVMDEGYAYDSDETESDSEIDRIAEMIVQAEGRLPQVGRISSFSEEEQQLQPDGATRSLEGHYYDDEVDWNSDERKDESKFWN
ncbi:hypothetical protein KI387_026828 [Taxus chinensis]|uniref:C2H2-type domain-containing protein n=1 Tax=Taxus chinensis TaxID=29808 RepID=A0AA38L0G0_TAXCH|nr:hypothetical protein KI387_026828 [Taxus chinensis]